MPSNLTMYLEASGVFTLEAPYNALMPAQIIYTCKGIRKLTDIIASGLDPFEEYYEPNGITDTAYQLDLLADVSIVSLVSSGGNWLYVPSTAILSYPTTSGVSYTAMMVGVSLGALPDSTDLTALKTSVSNVVKDLLGVTPTIKEVAVSDTALISYVKHTSIETARNTLRVTTKSDKAKLVEMTTERDALLLRVTQLEAYIKTIL